MSIPHLKPDIILPVDEGLPGLDLLFNDEWVWQKFCAEYGEPDQAPQRIRIRNFSYRPGSRALVSYVVEWKWRRWLIEDQFSVELEAGKTCRIFHYPQDPYLPGLHLAASAVEAPQLLNKYVSVFPHRLRIESMRYHPATRAVLCYTASWRQSRIGKLTLFVRVMPPARVSRLRTAVELAGRSGFAVPRLVGCWPEGGVVWMSSVPGNTVRSLIRSGTPPAPERIFDALDKLWTAPMETGDSYPIDILGGFKMTKVLLANVLKGNKAHQLLQQVTDKLERFSEEWRPSALAHNDFYDDQILLTPEGNLALVDFEEIGPGDPLIDVGNMLAHLRWMTRFGIAPEACGSYRRRFSAVALDRFGWAAEDLNLREAFAIFRLSSNPFRQLQRHWPSKVEAGLALAAEVLEGTP